jgi:hypothetical protein
MCFRGFSKFYINIEYDILRCINLIELGGDKYVYKTNESKNITECKYPCRIVEMQHTAWDN